MAHRGVASDSKRLKRALRLHRVPSMGNTAAPRWPNGETRRAAATDYLAHKWLMYWR